MIFAKNSKNHHFGELACEIFFLCRLLSKWSPDCSVQGVVAEMRQIHADYRVLWRKRDCTATLSRGEGHDPCLDRLLLLF